jgi:AraC family transcriptional regulator of adaptative response/methylated-DNA-[protein]-cysteine methyltransferase
MTSIFYQVFSSTLGEILVAGNSFAVTHVIRGNDKYLLTADFRLTYEDASPLDRGGYIRESCGAISDYLHSKATRIDVAVQLQGTDFQRKVWHEIRQIPYGKTATYSDLAEAIGMPDAFRAVANACGSNPVPLIIPCHRVVHKNGDGLGFAWGPEAKQFLLNLEREHVAAPADHAS